MQKYEVAANILKINLMLNVVTHKLTTDLCEFNAYWVLVDITMRNMYLLFFILSDLLCLDVTNGFFLYFYY